MLNTMMDWFDNLSVQHKLYLIVGSGLVLLFGLAFIVTYFGSQDDYYDDKTDYSSYHDPNDVVLQGDKVFAWHGQSLVDLGDYDIAKAYFVYPGKVHESDFFARSGFKFNSAQLVKWHGLMRSINHGDLLTKAQQDQYAKYGSHSYWSNWWTYYPGTSGYDRHLKYYQNLDLGNRDLEINDYASYLKQVREMVVDDSANVLSKHTKWMFYNQDVGYAQSELKPRIFLVTKNVDSDNVDNDAETTFGHLNYDKDQENHNGILMYVAINHSYYNVRLISDVGMQKFISQNQLNQLAQQYQMRLNQGGAQQFNVNLLAFNHDLTQLIWQQYLKPNLTDVNQYNVGEHINPAIERGLIKANWLKHRFSHSLIIASGAAGAGLIWFLISWYNDEIKDDLDDDDDSEDDKPSFPTDNDRIDIDSDDRNLKSKSTFKKRDDDDGSFM